jgi:alkylation response protein AidB-like acyl-CoA dehydrogenase
MDYQPPVRAQAFALETIADIGALAALPAFEAATPDLVDAVLREAARMAADVLAPHNAIGDREGAQLENGVVRLPAGFADAFRAFAEAGWIGLGAAADHGGQGLPFALACAVMEQVMSANMAFSLNPMLTLGAIEALSVHASPEQQRLFLRPLVEGRWTGTMNLTEPQAGSDVGALRTRAVPASDGSWRVKGQKIFITWGEHELAENIVHLVLARTPDAPAGTRGISLFIVPKYLPDGDGRPGQRNDVRAVKLEHKLGIHASPTCVMAFGDDDACVGYLVGAEGAGMKAMFTMMNHARINVGVQGYAIAERALQQAVGYAQARVQSARYGGPRQPVTIIEHADVRRMLATGRALVEAARAIALLNAAAVDRAHAEPDPAARADAQGLADLLTPVTKAFCTDVGVEVTNLAVQVFGGMGYIEETGVAQHYRDARIAPIYEGTNGIQALDLVGRKLGSEGGRHWQALIRRERAALGNIRGPLPDLAGPVLQGFDRLEGASRWLTAEATLDDQAAAAAPYLRLFALTLGAALLLRQADAATRRLGAGDGDAGFLEGRIAIARFFIRQLLPGTAALAEAVADGAGALGAIPAEALSG